METLESFVHYENLILFKKQLADPRITGWQKQLVQRLLAKEQAREFPLLRFSRADVPARLNGLRKAVDRRL